MARREIGKLSTATIRSKAQAGGHNPGLYATMAACT